MIDVIIGIISVSFLFFMVRIFMNMANWRLIIEGKNITHINWRGKQNKG